MSLLGALALPVAATTSGCEEETRMEHAGDHIEERMDDHSRIEEAADDIDEATDEAGERIEEAADEVRE